MKSGEPAYRIIPEIPRLKARRTARDGQEFFRTFSWSFLRLTSSEKPASIASSSSIARVKSPASIRLLAFLTLSSVPERSSPMIASAHRKAKVLTASLRLPVLTSG